MTPDQFHARRKVFRAEGRCPCCGEPAEPGRKNCAVHLEYFRNRIARIRRERAAERLCHASLDCTRLAFKCGLCVRHYLASREYQRPAQRNYYQNLREADLCRNCRGPAGGFEYCVDCAFERNQRMWRGTRHASGRITSAKELARFRRERKRA